MRKTLYRYPLLLDPIIEYTLPKGARVLSVRADDGFHPRLYALVDLSAELEPRRFRLAKVDEVVEDAEGLSFISSFQLEGGEVYHVFEYLPVHEAGV